MPVRSTYLIPSRLSHAPAEGVPGAVEGGGAAAVVAVPAVPAADGRVGGWMETGGRGVARGVDGGEGNLTGQGAGGRRVHYGGAGLRGR